MHYICNLSILFVCVSYAVCALLTEPNFKWPTPEEEALDEINDVELLKAVQSSMKEWSTKLRKHHRKKRAATKKVCYDDVGCFEDSGPFSYLEMLPSSPEEINTKFFFYSTKNRSDGPLLELPFVNMTAAMPLPPSSVINNENNSISSTSTSFGSATSSSSSSMLDPPSTIATMTTTSTTTTPTPTTTAKHHFSTKTPFTLNDLHGFNELSTRVIVHGFGSACPHVWIYEMKTALMAVENCIVICVDWENGATFPNYVRAAANTRLVGKQLAMLLQNLQKYKGLNLAKTHIIGFSLGAHVAGFAGAELPGLSRITGLDPAGPLFESQHPKARLDKTDAKFVDVIHSNGENLILGGLGSWQPMGHVDFYPNGGRVQTGCSNLFVGAVTDFIWSQAAEVEGRSLCNHRRAYKFFIDSVAPRCLFPAFPCDSYDNFLKGKCFPCKPNNEHENIDNGAGDNNSRCGNMGYYADRSTGRGQLYLVTREEEPFCAHQFQIEIHNSYNDLPLKTIGKLEATLEGEGGLNETFLITDKEDAEFFASDIVSRIVVPHPALGFPTSLTLQYKSYSGWLSKGLPHWDIDKVVLTDSFGLSHSLCQPSLSLTSGIPVYMALQPGLCEIPKPTDPITKVEISTKNTQSSATQQTGQDRVDGDDGIETVKQKKDIYNLNVSYKRGKNHSSAYSLKKHHESVQWQPVIDSNSLLDKEISESSRSLNSDVSEIFEPVLKTRNTINRGRNLHEFDKKDEIVEPILKSTTPKTRKVKEIPLDELEQEKDKTQHPKTEPITVQLFPFRLGELLERAERYARETILPLISEKAPKFFGWNRKDLFDRKPRYIPLFDFDEAESVNIAQTSARSSSGSNSSSSSSTIDNNNNSISVFRNLTGLSVTDHIYKGNYEIEKDLNSGTETQQYKNILELLRKSNKENTVNEDRSFSEILYYVNKKNNLWDFNMKSSSTMMTPLNQKTENYREIHIDLPTYRPPSTLAPKSSSSSSSSKFTTNQTGEREQDRKS